MSPLGPLPHHARHQSHAPGAGWSLLVERCLGALHAAGSSMRQLTDGWAEPVRPASEPPTRRPAAVYRHRAQRPPAYAPPAAPAAIAAAPPSSMAPRDLQRRYPLVSALLDEIDLMGAPPSRR